MFRQRLCSANLELYVLDADFLVGLFVVIEPVAFCKIDGGKFGVGL